MNRIVRWCRGVAAPLVMGILSSPIAWAAEEPDSSAEEVQVAMLSYTLASRTSRCFSDAFLTLIERETTIRAERTMRTVALDSMELLDHPFSIMSGEGSFELTGSEIENLRRYLLAGGFLLASAGCSDGAWGASMERALQQALPGQALVELEPDHPLFHALFDVHDFMSRKRREAKVFGIEIEGRLAVVYSPQGLNDTNEAGGLSEDGRRRVGEPSSPRTASCCCCGGDEVRSAKYINANALVYALVQ